MNSPLISIIVPVYNTENYLHRCIDSILAQTFTDFELLLINDGSTDSSGTMCDKFAAQDIRVKVIHKPNTGVSDTRNIGLDIACGKYILFLDSDDYWYDNTSLEILVKTAEKYDLDIVRGTYKAVDYDGQDLFQKSFTNEQIDYSEQVLTSAMFYTNIMYGENFLFLSLIKRDAIGDLRLNPKLSFLEDMEFYARFLLKSRRCMFVKYRFYAYRKISSSASNTYKIKNLADSFSMCDVFNECVKGTKDEVLRKAYRYNSIMMYYWTLDTITLDSYFSQRKEIIEKLGLKELQKKVYAWSKTTNNKYPIIIKVSPITGIWLFKIKHFIGKIIRFLIKY